ncbi:MAG: DUF465 domain-containing protein [Pseudomonadota bacterium]
MNLEAHLAELETRHRQLEQDIASALQSPATDPVKVTELKKKKLKLKELIEKQRSR